MPTMSHLPFDLKVASLKPNLALNLSMMVSINIRIARADKKIFMSKFCIAGISNDSHISLRKRNNNVMGSEK